MLLNVDLKMNQEWIKPHHPIILRGQSVDLLPLEREHFDKLYETAAIKKIWEFLLNNYSDKQKFLIDYNDALIEREKGNNYPFVIFHKTTSKIIGSTRLFDIHSKDKKLEIGWTWLHPDYWGTEINFECKLLLLTFCFETLKIVRVQFKTSEENLRSRKAIEKIGGEFEGIFRKDRIRENGTFRNSIYYSILDTEWGKKKQMLKQQIINKRKIYL